MYNFLIMVCCLSALVFARPDVSLGYHYDPHYNSGSNLLAAPVLTTSYYPTASGAVGAVNQGNFVSGAATSAVNSGNFLASNYNVPGFSSAGASSLSSASAASSSFPNSYGILDSSVISSGNINSASYTFNPAGSGAGGGVQGIGQGFQQQYPPQYPQLPPIITKHFYVHSAPEDHDDQEIVRYVTIGRPTKNYRVVFINVPSSTTTKAKIIASVAPTEDRTAIYVLSKKANELDISADVVTPQPAPENKPDVFFIKYETPQEAIHAQHVIQAQYDKLEGSSSYSNEGNTPVQSIIGSLDSQSNAASSASVQSSSQVSGQGFSQAYVQGTSQASVQGSSQSSVLGSSQASVQGSSQASATDSSSNQGQIQQINSGQLQPQGNYLPPTAYRRRRYSRY